MRHIDTVSEDLYAALTEKMNCAINCFNLLGAVQISYNEFKLSDENRVAQLTVGHNGCFPVVHLDAYGTRPAVEKIMKDLDFEDIRYHFNNHPFDLAWHSVDRKGIAADFKINPQMSIEDHVRQDGVLL